MPSSTSSSDPYDRAPRLPWGRTWAVVGLLVLLVVGGVEGILRSRGAEPSVKDDEALWSYHRDRVAHHGENAVVLLGASRMQLGFDLDTARTALPDREIIQLAVNASSPVGALRDLAQDETFAGVVICSITANGFLRDRWNDLDGYLGHRARMGPGDHVELLLRGATHTRFVTANMTGSAYLATRFDRSRQADYTRIDIAEHRRWRLQRVRQSYEQLQMPSPAQWRDTVREVDTWVRRIHERGGRVIFVRFPTTGGHWQLDEAQMPRTRYWDRLAACTDAQTLHFRDVPDLARFECPDTSHLDRRDAPAFTASLLDALELGPSVTQVEHVAGPGSG